MADGRTHGAITIALAAALPAVGLAIGLPERVCAGLSLGCLVGLIVEPDLDIPRRTASERRVLRALGFIGFFWIWYWTPYARFIRHRSPLSHLPGLGTAVRLVYLLGPPLIVAYLAGHPIYPANDPFNWALAVGLAVSDAAHWLADGMPR